MGKQPPTEIIDEEIRSLISLLNLSPYWETVSSCAGHENKENYANGWISMKPVGGRKRLWNFLTYLAARLDNTHFAAIGLEPGEFGATRQISLNHLDVQDAINFDRSYELYRQCGAEQLFWSGKPIMFIRETFFLEGATGKWTYEEELKIWQLARAVTAEILQTGDERLFATQSVNEERFLYVQLLTRIPYIWNITRRIRYNRPWLNIEAMPDQCSRRRCWELMCMLLNRLDTEQAVRFARNEVIEAEKHEVYEIYKRADAENLFWSDTHILSVTNCMHIFVPCAGRTPEERKKIWQLIEMAADEYINAMDMVVNYECKGGSNCPMSSGDCDFFENSPATSNCQHYPGSCKTGDDGKCTAA